ncbi:histo-blood group ABO system transferase 2-like [Aquarana catesbeiana]|uniref:histo-blood group ABO system transferase 2-like n=1 Tax=Aquarana catesbeiana TaxID=8400 RepID=UPI003CC92583
MFYCSSINYIFVAFYIFFLIDRRNLQQRLCSVLFAVFTISASSSALRSRRDLLRESTHLTLIKGAHYGVHSVSGPLLETAVRFFMVGHNVTYYVFTDNIGNVVKPKMGEGRNLQLHEVSADKRWQDVSMRRMEILTAVTKEQMSNEIDYLVCADVDMVFNDHMGVEILGDLFATIHPGYFLTDPQRFTYERRPISAAYIPYGKGDFYYMAALYGGKVEEIYKLSTACHNGIKEDKKKNIEAVWQEESHLNRYLVYNKPTSTFSNNIWDTNLPNGELIKIK